MAKKEKFYAQVLWQVAMAMTMAVLGHLPHCICPQIVPREFDTGVIRFYDVQ